MTQTIGLVPSLSVQVWSRKSLAELGWREKTAALVSGPPPLEIWADTSQLLDCEDWGRMGQNLFNISAMSSARRPIVTPPAPRGERRLELATDWFDRRRGVLAKSRRARQRSGGFDWNTLEDPRDRKGPAPRRAGGQGECRSLGLLQRLGRRFDRVAV